MKAFDAMGEAIHAISKDQRLWRYPLVGSAIVGAMVAAIGIGENARLVGNHPNAPIVLTILVLLLAILVKASLLYYPVKAYQYGVNEREFSEGKLLLRSIPRGLITMIIAIGYGIVLGLLMLMIAIPFIVLYFILKGLFGWVGGVVGIIVALPFVFWGIGIASMMVPAYIFSDDPGKGFSVIGMGFNFKKEIAAFGAIVLLLTVAILIATRGIEQIFSWGLHGFWGALIVGASDGAISGLISALNSIAGAVMYRHLSKSPVKMGEEVRLDPDWLASL